MNVRFTVPVGMPETITLTLTPEELLALAAVLDHADPEFLRVDGVQEDVIEVTDGIYGTVERAAAAIYGDDWDVLTNVETESEQYDDTDELFDEDVIFPLDTYDVRF